MHNSWRKHLQRNGKMQTSHKNKTVFQNIFCLFSRNVLFHFYRRNCGMKCLGWAAQQRKRLSTFVLLSKHEIVALIFWQRQIFVPSASLHSILYKILLRTSKADSKNSHVSLILVSTRTQHSKTFANAQNRPLSLKIKCHFLTTVIFWLVRAPVLKNISWIVH